METKVRELLRDIADEIPPHLLVPSELRTRARRRIARNAAVAAGVAVLLAFGSVAGVHALGRAHPPTPANEITPTGTISFVAGSTLHLVRPDGSILRQFSLPICAESCKLYGWAWAPDGSRVAFQVARAPAGTRFNPLRIDSYNLDLYVVNADGSHPRVVGSCRACSQAGFTWSPDGSRIAFQEDGFVTVVGVDDGIVQRLGDCRGPASHDIGADSGACSRLAWSPDGSRIAFAQADARSGGLHMVDAHGGGESRVATIPLNYAPPYVSWSPDATRILYATDEGLAGVIDVDHGTLTPLPDNNDYPSWSPDGSRIAYARLSWDQKYRGYRAEVRVSNTDRTGETLVDSWPCCLEGTIVPVWSPDGRSLAFAVSFQGGPAGESGIYVTRPDGTGLRRISSSFANPVWRPAP